jgi:hypothetical protein
LFIVAPGGPSNAVTAVSARSLGGPVLGLRRIVIMGWRREQLLIHSQRALPLPLDFTVSESL